MYLKLNPRSVVQAHRHYPAPTSPSPQFSRHIRIRSSSDAEAEKGPPEGHVLERKTQPKNTIDPQAQSAQGSSQASHEERPAYVHSRASKGNVMGGATSGTKEPAAAPSLWLRAKQMLGLSSKSSKYGGGNRQSTTKDTEGG